MLVRGAFPCNGKVIDTGRLSCRYTQIQLLLIQVAWWAILGDSSGFMHHWSFWEGYEFITIMQFFYLCFKSFISSRLWETGSTYDKRWSTSIVIEIRGYCHSAKRQSLEVNCSFRCLLKTWWLGNDDSETTWESITGFLRPTGICSVTRATSERGGQLSSFSSHTAQTW